MPTAIITAEDLFAAARVVARGVTPERIIECAEFANQHRLDTGRTCVFGDGSLSAAAGALRLGLGPQQPISTDDPLFLAAMRDVCAALVERAALRRAAA